MTVLLPSAPALLLRRCFRCCLHRRLRRLRRFCGDGSAGGSRVDVARGGSTPWSTGVVDSRSRSAVHSELLEDVLEAATDPVGGQYSIPPPDGRTSGEGEQDGGGDG